MHNLCVPPPKNTSMQQALWTSAHPYNNPARKLPLRQEALNRAHEVQGVTHHRGSAARTALGALASGSGSCSGWVPGGPGGRQEA